MNDGTIYEGDFKDDKFHGRGKMLFKVPGKQANGDPIYKVFEGFFESGLVSNEGKIYFTDGSKGDYYGDQKEFDK